MEFSKKKLPQEMLRTLYQAKIETIRPYAPMFAPVYVYLKKNQKLVSIKSPLDFFTPRELDRLKTCEHFYFPHFFKSVFPFREAGLKVREILISGLKVKTNALLSTVPYVLSDQILSTIGSLWWDQGDGDPGIEPFLVAVFVNEVCDLLPGEKLLQAREMNVHILDRALLTSSWGVFLALHLGYCDLEFLNQFRLQVFNEILTGAHSSQKILEVDELTQFAIDTINIKDLKSIGLKDLESRKEKVAQKLKSRLKRIESEFLSKGERVPTIFGERGFVDV